MLFRSGNVYATTTMKEAIHSTSRKNSNSMDMTDFLQLMVVQLQNQTMDNTADTSDMLNQLVQMQMVPAMTNMTDASIMGYASSLVGKEVTIGIPNANGKVEETVVEIIGTGMANGEQVIFTKDGDTFKLSSIMAVGRLPEPDKNEDGDKTDGTEEPGDVDQPGGTEGADKRGEIDPAVDPEAEKNSVG